MVFILKYIIKILTYIHIETCIIHMSKRLLYIKKSISKSSTSDFIYVMIIMFSLTALDFAVRGADRVQP